MFADTSRRHGLWLRVAVLILATIAAVRTVKMVSIWRSMCIQAQGNLWGDEFYGYDFVQFVYVADTWRNSELDRLYDPQFQVERMNALAGKPSGSTVWLRYNYPPFFAWLPAMLSRLSYRQAYVAWLTLQVGFFLLAAIAWRFELAEKPSAFLLVVFLFLVSPPFLANLMIGQTAFVALAAFSWALFLLGRQRDFAAGLCVAALFYKPPLGIVIGPLLIWKRRWRALAGVAAGAGLLLVASLMISPHAVANYWSALEKLMGRAAGTPGFYDQQFNWIAFVAVLTGRPTDQWRVVDWLLAIVPQLLAISFIAMAWRGPWNPQSRSFAAGCSAVCLATLLLSPYLFFYDVAILGVACVYSMKTLDTRTSWHTWWIVGTVAVVFVWTAGLTPLLDRLPLRVQVPPLALLVWLALEAGARRGQERPPIFCQSEKG